MDTDHDKREAELLARLEAERAQRLHERIATGELVSIPLCIIGGSEAEVRSKVEQTKADKLAELRAAGDQREVVFAVTTVRTGVRRHGEAADPASVPSAPGFTSREAEVIRPSLPLPVAAPDAPEEDESPHDQETPAPVIESYVCVQTRQCHDDDDAGEICEGWFSVDGKVVTVTSKAGGPIGSRVMLKGEDARVVAKELLRAKSPEAESFHRG